jgi:hypothetical protein
MIPALVQFGLLAAGILAALGLFLSLKRELRAQARSGSARLDEIQEQLRQARHPAPEPPPPSPAPVALHSGMNMNKRVQAVRLLRRGEDIGHVAAAVGAPRSEIELLLRVQKLSSRRAAGATD